MCVLYVCNVSITHVCYTYKHIPNTHYLIDLFIYIINKCIYTHTHTHTHMKMAVSGNSSYNSASTNFKHVKKTCAFGN